MKKQQKCHYIKKLKNQITWVNARLVNISATDFQPITKFSLVDQTKIKLLQQQFKKKNFKEIYKIIYNNEIN